MSLLRRLERHKIALGAAAILGAVAIVVTLPITLPIVGIQLQLRKRRLLRLVSTFACVKCGALLGADSLRLGDERWQEIASGMHSDSTLRFRRLVRTVDAVGPGCRREYLYVEKRATLEALAA
jgi:hypothetical protein